MDGPNPFTPTFGVSPPLLVGRDDELELFVEALEEGPGSPARASLFTGQRGSGKTVLLNTLEDAARSRGWAVVSETARAGLAGEIASTSIPGLLRDHPGEAFESVLTGGNASLAGFGGGMKRERVQRFPVAPSLRSALTCGHLTRTFRRALGVNRNEALTHRRPYSNLMFQNATSRTDGPASGGSMVVVDGVSPCFVGQPLRRLEDPALLTGRSRYLDDLDLFPRTLVAAIVRSPHPHARIRAIRMERARRHPGVTAVIGLEKVNAKLRSFPLSLRAPMPHHPVRIDNLRFVGEPVAVVIATDRYTAEDAAELVEVDYETLPAVIRTTKAMDSGAPLLRDTAGINIASDRAFNFGNLGDAFAAAEHVVTGEYSSPRYSSIPVECYSVVSDWQDEADGPYITTSHFGSGCATFDREG